MKILTFWGASWNQTPPLRVASCGLAESVRIPPIVKEDDHMSTTAGVFHLF